MLAICGVAIAVAAIAGTWSPEPPPEFEFTEIAVDGNPYEGTAIQVAPGAVMTLATSVIDEDTLTDGSAADILPDDAAIIWTATDGSLSASRVPTGSSVEWTAPELEEEEEYRYVTVTAQADDDTTEEPGDPLDGHDPNRDDPPADTQSVLFQVVRPACNVTGVASNKATVTVGENFTLTATGAGLAGVNWEYIQNNRDPIGGGGANWNDFMPAGSPVNVSIATPGYYLIRGYCNGTRATTNVTVVDVDRVIKDGSDPEQVAGMGTVGVAHTVRAMPIPAGAAFPANQPVWTLAKPALSMVGVPAAGATATITPDVAGTYTLSARCAAGATKSYTLTVGGNRVEQTVLMIMRDPEVNNQRDFDAAVGGSGYPAGNVKIVAAFLVTVGFDTNALPKNIEIKIAPTSVSGSTPSAGPFTGVGAAFASVALPAIGGVAKQSGATQYNGAAVNGCVVLEAGAASNGPFSPAYNPAGNEFPVRNNNYNFRRINANGRWFKCTYAIAVPGGGAPPTLTVTASQQAIAANNAGRACP